MTAPPTDAPPIDDALLAIIRCPVTGERLTRVGDELRTPSGRVYRIVDGLAVLVPARTMAAPDQGTAPAQDAGTDSTGTS